MNPDTWLGEVLRTARQEAGWEENYALKMAVDHWTWLKNKFDNEADSEETGKLLAKKGE